MHWPSPSCLAGSCRWPTGLPSFVGTTSGFFSSYMSSDWLSGNEIFSLIGRLPGRLPRTPLPPFAPWWWPDLVAVVWLARSLNAAATAMMMQIITVRMAMKIPIDRIGDSSNSPWGPVGGEGGNSYNLSNFGMARKLSEGNCYTFWGWWPLPFWIW